MAVTLPPMIPFFQGTLDQVKELQALCQDRGIDAQPAEPPGGCGSS